MRNYWGGLYICVPMPSRIYAKIKSSRIKIVFSSNGLLVSSVHLYPMSAYCHYIINQVNNAGLGLGKSFLETSLQEFDAIMNTNVKAPFHLTQLCLPYLEKTKGKIIFYLKIAQLLREVGRFDHYNFAKSHLVRWLLSLKLTVLSRSVIAV